MSESTTPTQERYDPTTYRSGARNGVTTWTFSSNMPHRAPLIAYIAGIEIPITSATVSAGVWNIPACRITLFPDPKLQRFGAEDRVPVVLFYLDEYIEPEKPTWRMFFEGEITGWSYTNSALGRSVSFDCTMDIACWTQLFLFYMSTVQGLADGFTNSSKDGSVITQAVAELPYALFHRGLMPESATTVAAVPAATPAGTPPAAATPGSASIGYITRPYDFAYNTIRALIAKGVPDKLRCIPAVNFFTRWCRRQNFQNKWVALPFLDDVWDTKGSVPVKRTDQPAGVFPIFRAVKAQFALEAVEKQLLKEYSGRSIYEMLQQVLDITFMELVMLPTPAYVKTTTAGEILGPGPVYLGQPLTEAELAQAANTKAQGLPSSYSTPYVTNPREPGRLTNYFVKPICVFGLPPTCNVIFPSMTPQISYSENYATQPTRLYIEDQALAGLVCNEDNPEKLLVNVLARGYPPAADRRFRERVSSIFKTGKNILLYPEEFFKGPVTAVSPAPKWFLYFQQYLQAQSDQGVDTTQAVSDFTATADDKTVPPSPGQTSLTEGDLYKLYAQYEYFRQRYDKRQGAVECAFHPYLVPGFPMVAFDEVITSQFHVIGYLMNFNHTVTAESISTVANFSYGRGIIEFLTDIASEIDNPQNPARKGLACAAAPPEPLPEVRDILQHEWYADQFYQQLLYRRTAASKNETTAQPAVCRVRDLLQFANEDGTLTPLKIEGKNENQLRKEREMMTLAKTGLELFKQQTLLDVFVKDWSKGTGGDETSIAGIGAAHPEIKQAITAITNLRTVAQIGGYALLDNQLTTFLNWAKNSYQGASEQLPYLLQAIDTALKQPPVTKHNLGQAAEKPMVPTPGLEPLFDSYDAAMKYCARPICTLEEYISFIGGVRDTPIDEVAYVAEGGSVIPSARYYARIRVLKGATEADGAKVTLAHQGIAPDAVPVDPNAVGPPAPQNTTTEGGQAVDPTFPVMRAQWDQILLSHRAAVYSSVKLSR